MEASMDQRQQLSNSRIGIGLHPIQEDGEFCESSDDRLES